MNGIVVNQLIESLGNENVITEVKEKKEYLYDESNPKKRPQANEDSIVVKPGTAQEVAEVLKLANEKHLIVVARGGGTGLAGGAIPTQKSIVLSLERLNRILEVDKENMMVTVEAGVTLDELYKEMDKHEGIWFPAHPAFDLAQLGGIAATNGGGARAIRHGIMRRHVVGMEVVLPTGEVLQLGGKLIKDNAGFNLMNLIIGSEGTLAVITKLILRLYPEDKFSGTLLVGFDSVNEAAKASNAIIQSGVVPLAIEYLDHHLLIGAAKITKERMGLDVKWPITQGNADLIVVLSEVSKAQFDEVVQTVQKACKVADSLQQIFVTDKKEAKEIMDVRAHYYYYVQENMSHYFDMTVPVAQIPSFTKELNELFEKYGTKTNIVAHIADGNLHNEIILDENGEVLPFAEELKSQMYQLCLSYGGTITGEHGIGKSRVADLKVQKNEKELALMKGIKAVFDPNGILNPGTVVE